MSAAWDGFISSISEGKLWKWKSVGSVVPGAVATSIVYTTLDLVNYSQFILYFMHLLSKAH